MIDRIGWLWRVVTSTDGDSNFNHIDSYFSIGEHLT